VVIEHHRFFRLEQRGSIQARKLSDAGLCSGRCRRAPFWRNHWPVNDRVTLNFKSIACDPQSLHVRDFRPVDFQCHNVPARPLELSAVELIPPAAIAVTAAMNGQEKGVSRRRGSFCFPL